VATGFPGMSCHRLWKTLEGSTWVQSAQKWLLLLHLNSESQHSRAECDHILKRANGTVAMHETQARQALQARNSITSRAATYPQNALLYIDGKNSQRQRAPDALRR
jgi:hypothetical protein